MTSKHNVMMRTLCNVGTYMDKSKNCLTNQWLTDTQTHVDTQTDTYNEVVILSSSTADI